MLNTTRLAIHRTLAGSNLHRRTATAAEAMLTRPSTYLGSVTKKLEQIPITILHELTQALPPRTGHFDGELQLKQKDRLSIEMAQALLAQNRKLQTFEPISRKQYTVVIDHKLLPAMYDCPPSRHSGIEQRRLPA